jgi:hypothetical protein
LGVALRVLSYDHRFLRADAIPNHDMSQGLSAFALNMASVREFGSYAWWMPGTGTGYDGAYQAMLSPLAPTMHSPVFQIWAFGVRSLAAMDIAIPEYAQYGVVTYLVLPFLAFWAAAVFGAVIFRSRLVVALWVTTYALSGIGIWNGSFFYFQEAIGFWLAAAALVVMARRPTWPRAAVACAAAVYSVAAPNYWTLYQAPFLFALVCIAGLVYRGRTRQDLRHALAVHPRRVLALTVIVLFCGGAVCAIVLPVVNEGARFERTSGAFTMATAFDRVTEIRMMTSELFDPSIARGVALLPQYNAVHNARYIGAVLVPLLALLPVISLGRRERWLLGTTAVALVTSFAPGLLLALWRVAPGLDRIQHFFYFYSHFWQICVVLLACCVLDLLMSGLSDAERRRSRHVLAGLGGVLGAGFVLSVFVGGSFPAGSEVLESALLLALVAGCAAAAVWAIAANGRRSGLLAIGVLVVVAVADLSRYYYTVERLDEEFTAERWSVHQPSPEDRKVLLSPVASLRGTQSFHPDLRGMLPVVNDMWPENRYLVDQRRQVLLERAPTLEAAWSQPGFALEPRFVPSGPQRAAAAIDDADAVRGKHLYVERHPTKPLRSTAEASSVMEEVDVEWLRWSLNDLTFTVDLKRSGWMYVPVMHAPDWQVLQDGRRVSTSPANLVGTAMPVEQGVHRIEMSYRPAGRGRIGWLVALLVSMEVALCCLARRWRQVDESVGRRASPKRASASRPKLAG